MVLILSTASATEKTDAAADASSQYIVNIEAYVCYSLMLWQVQNYPTLANGGIKGC